MRDDGGATRRLTVLHTARLKEREEDHHRHHLGLESLLEGSNTLSVMVQTLVHGLWCAYQVRFFWGKKPLSGTIIGRCQITFISFRIVSISERNM